MTTGRSQGGGGVVIEWDVKVNAGLGGPIVRVVRFLDCGKVLREIAETEDRSVLFLDEYLVEVGRFVELADCLLSLGV